MSSSSSSHHHHHHHHHQQQQQQQHHIQKIYLSAIYKSGLSSKFCFISFFLILKTHAIEKNKNKLNVFWGVLFTLNAIYNVQHSPYILNLHSFTPNMQANIYWYPRFDHLINTFFPFRNMAWKLKHHDMRMT